MNTRTIIETTILKCLIKKEKERKQNINLMIISYCLCNDIQIPYFDQNLDYLTKYIISYFDQCYSYTTDWDLIRHMEWIIKEWYRIGLRIIVEDNAKYCLH